MNQMKHSAELEAEKPETVHLCPAPAEMIEDQQTEEIVAGQPALVMQEMVFVSRVLELEGAAGGKVACPEVIE